jgi:hypothetical protein
VIWGFIDNYDAKLKLKTGKELLREPLDGFLAVSLPLLKG